MMQSCASAARLRGTGSNLSRGMKAMGAADPRHLGSSWRCIALTRTNAELHLLLSYRDKIVQTAGFMTAPAGTSPVVT
jgi:hypothetical protein